jgi:hypothetical protein
MDSLAGFYKERHRQALLLAREGNHRDALDILFELRLKPDLGVYRRAHVSFQPLLLFPAALLM